MKKRKTAGRAILGVLVLAALVYFGLGIFRAVSQPLTTSVVTRSVSEETVPLSGFVVR